MKPLKARISELRNELSGGKFPTKGQLKIMLRAEGYPKDAVERMFAIKTEK